MRQSITQLWKIVIFCLGGVLVITGIYLARRGIQLLRTEGILSDCIAVSVITLAAGICIFILAFKLPSYLAKTRKMSKEEKVIHNIKTYMKHRKSRIVTCSIFLVIMLAISILIMSMGNKLARTMTTEHIRLLVAAKLMVCHYLFGIFTGFLAFMLIDEFAGFTKNKHRLTLNMWERIQELENDVKELKACAQVDIQQISDVDGGDTASGAE